MLIKILDDSKELEQALSIIKRQESINTNAKAAKHAIKNYPRFISNELSLSQKINELERRAWTAESELRDIKSALSVIIKSANT